MRGYKKRLLFIILLVECELILVGCGNSIVEKSIEKAKSTMEER
ncbi:MAG: hypothetical protein ACRC2K_10725 [Clostridium sp.]